MANQCEKDIIRPSQSIKQNPIGLTAIPTPAATPPPPDDDLITLMAARLLQLLSRKRQFEAEIPAKIQLEGEPECELTLALARYPAMKDISLQLEKLAHDFGLASSLDWVTEKKMHSTSKPTAWDSLEIGAARKWKFDVGSMASSVSSANDTKSGVKKSFELFTEKIVAALKG